MHKTYKAMQVTKPGLLELVERTITGPGSNEVLIKVDACGMCGADIGAIEGIENGLAFPRVPGHEVVGRIIAIGISVPSIWKLGQRVGVGRLGGHCHECTQCRRGQFQLCQNQPFVGSSQDGGYAEMMLARHTALVSIPQELSSEEAAPLLCAGIATFNALKNSGAQAGDLVVVQGIGGLGHLALQYARKMGFKVVAVGRGDGIAEDVMALGAHIYIDSDQNDSVSILKNMGGAQVIISTITNSAAVSGLFSALAPHGKLIVLGVGKDPLSISAGQLVVGERVVQGKITGTPYESERTLDFSILADIRPKIETMPFEQANEAYQKIKSGEARFRMVLTMSELS